MKINLTTLDIVYLIPELEEKLLGARVDQVYNIDKKTFLIRLHKQGSAKTVLLLESGRRIHTTSFEWPKNPTPSGFAMKLRKHIKNKRLEKIVQLGKDRILDFQFGSDEAAYHIIVELYDKGNIILTDCNYSILNLVRPHGEGDERQAAHENYNTENVKTTFSISLEEIEKILEENKGKGKSTIKQLFFSKVEFGGALFSYALKSEGLTPNNKVSQEEAAELSKKIFKAMQFGDNILENVNSQPKGAFIVLAKDSEFYDEFHPFLLSPHYENVEQVKFETLDEAIDNYFSKIESQKIEKRQYTKEKEAMKKLDKFQSDHQKRLDELQSVQEQDKIKAELIMLNQPLVDNALVALRKLVASQISWDEIWERVQEAALNGDPVADKIKSLNLIKNQFSVLLNNDNDDDNEETIEKVVDISLDFSAFSNATKYYDLKRASARKEEKTIESQDKAFKSAQKKTLANLKEVQAITNIKQARKIFWFEKFQWFISTENYLIIAGRDAQQNEMIVKKYMKPNDLYFHADMHGSPTVIVKADKGESVPPKTINEAGCFAICCSSSWDEKVLASCWYVYGNQVTKSAPTGEYLSTGSFMIRGKKNYLPPSQLVMGFGFLFRISDECIPSHKDERTKRIENANDEKESPEKNNSSNDKDEKEGEIEFPDTEVGRLAKLSVIDDNNETTIVSTMNLPSINITKEKIAKGKGKSSGGGGSNKDKPLESNKNKQEENSNSTTGNSNNSNTNNNNNNNNPNKKRGQHGKLKKIKEKYKNQDEEERELRMKLLQPAAALAKEKEELEKAAAAEKEVKEKPKREKPPPKVKLENQEDDNEEEVEVEQETTNLLDTLTGCPLEEDELLFAVPIVAPYQSLQNFKFKIKMIPGNVKRGKAAKSALESFIRNKDISPRERDLLKSVKDQDLSRNFPGKVKLGQLNKK